MSSVYDLYQYYLNKAKQQEAAELVNPTVQPTLISQVPVDQGGYRNDDNNMDTTGSLSVGSGPPNPLLAGIMSVIAPPVGLAMNAQIMADKGMLPGPFNKIFGSRASGNVELGLPPAINMQAVYDDFGFGGEGQGTPSGGFTGTTSQMDALASEYGGSFSGGGNGGSGGSSGGTGDAGPNDSGDTGGPFAKGGVVLPRKELTGIESLRGRYGKR